MTALATKYIDLRAGSLNSIFVDSIGFPIDFRIVCNYYYNTDEHDKLQ